MCCAPPFLILQPARLPALPVSLVTFPCPHLSHTTQPHPFPLDPAHTQARLAFLPAFHLEYEHGESFNAHGERVPAQYEAIIAGTGAPLVFIFD